jgi:TolB protein
LIALLIAGGVLIVAPASSAAVTSDHPACQDDGAILGTNGNDTIAGTDGDDVICALGGNDRITGGGGDDVLIGGAGGDTIKGENGSDFCLGGDGDDGYSTCEQCPTQAANTQFAFSRTNTTSHDGVYKMLPNGRRAHRLTEDMKPPYENHSYAPAWSADGKQIAFEAGRENTFLYTASANGTRTKVVAKIDSSYTPDWAPDGSEIMFEVEDEGDETFNLYSVPSGGGNPTALTASGEGRFHPHYSSDGTLVATEGNTEDYSKRALIMSPNGKNEHELLPDHASYSPTWSPNSQMIAFAGATGDGQRYDTPTDIYVVDRNGSGATRLTDLGGIADYPDWSPDGRKIVFLRRDNHSHDLYVMNADGSDLQQVTNDARAEYEPTWSPDGTQILFTKQHGMNYDLWIMDADGSDLRAVTHTKTAHEVEPQWRPRSCDE